MSTPPHRALRIVLRIFAVLIAAAGLLMIFVSKSFLVRLPLSPPENEISDLFLFLLREMGGLVLMLSLLVFYASRDPARNVAIIDALIAGLLRIGRYVPAVAVYAGPPTVLPSLSVLGTLRCPVGDSSTALLFAAAGDCAGRGLRIAGASRWRGELRLDRLRFGGPTQPL